MRYEYLIETSQEIFDALVAAYPDPDVSSDSEEIAPLVRDWQFYSWQNTENNNAYRIAISPSLGCSRSLTANEWKSLQTCSPDWYQKYIGILPDPLSPAELALRHKARERRFHIELSYSTCGASPEDALGIMFAAMRQPGSMFAAIHEEGGGLTEIDGDELVAIAAKNS